MTRGVTVLGVILLVLGVAGIVSGGAAYLAEEALPPDPGRPPARAAGPEIPLAGAILLSLGMAVLAVGPRGGRG